MSDHIRNYLSSRTSLPWTDNQMPRTDEATDTLAAAAARWRDRCLLDDGSALSDQSLWTAENIQELVTNFVDNLDMGEGNFLSKLRAQLAGAAPDARKLAAEMLWLMYLIVHESSMQPGTKRSQVEKVWGWSGEAVPEDPEMLEEALSAGVANPGTAFHTHRWRELVFFIRFAEGWKQLPEEEQRRLTEDGWEFGRWMDALEESTGRQLRHILLFLLFPDSFDPIVTGQHKRLIVRRWYAETGGSLEELDFKNRLSMDRALLTVRQMLQAESPERRVHFYLEPWVSEWRQGGQGDGPETPLVARPTAVAWARDIYGDARVWVMAAGEGGRLWPEFNRDGIIALGLDEIGELSEYTSKEQLNRDIGEARGVENPFNDALAGWQFAHEIQPGDHIIAKEGRSKLLGWGVVTGGYRYDATRSEYRNLRDVEWNLTGRWTLPEDQRVTPKTLTDYTGAPQWLHLAIQLMKGEAPGPSPKPDGYPLEKAVQGVFLASDRFSQIVDLLGRKMNVILQGPPGVGKTFIARRVAYRLMDEADPARVQMVQFHQAYAYEDFVQGYRPTDEGGFRLRNGVFYEFCRRAADDLDRKYVFIVDEINRGNLPRILGELMMLIEGDKRDSKYAVPLTYSNDPFYVPDNVYILGMMNTADRSLAMVDYALRRRFGFVSLEPEFQSDGFTSYLMEAGVPEEMVRKIEERMSQLNEEIRADKKNLGPGFEVGHSYFVPGEQDISLDEVWYSRVIRSEVEPLLREYWFDQPAKVDEYVQRLIA